jgi:hypothetical protein
VLGEAVRHRHVHLALGVEQALVELDAGAHRGRGAARRGEHALLERRDLLGAAVPDQELRLGEVRHDVGRAAPVRDDAVDAGLVQHVLAQRVDGVEGEDAGVERVDAELGAAGGVRGLAVEAHGDAGGGERAADRHRARARVEHQGRVDALEHAGAEQQDLAAAALLGRAADHQQLAAAGLERAAQRARRAEGGGGDQVVAAGVAHLGEGVVLGHQGDARAARAPKRWRATNAVSRPPAGASTSKPASRRDSTSLPALRCSSNISSGWAWRSSAKSSR